jgi:D-alanine-D-alanine ligase
MTDEKALRILLLFEGRETPLPGGEYEQLMKSGEDLRTEGDVVAALRELGHEVHLGPIREHPREILAHVDLVKPDLVWNLVEAFRGQRSFESHVVGLLELLGVPHTGCGQRSLMICKDKALSKKILRHHRVPVPPFVVSHRTQPLRKLGRSIFPVLVKPLAEEGSVGIVRDSFAENEEQAVRRIAFLHERLKTDVIVEHYVEGREIYAGVLGDSRLKALPLRELQFTKVPDGEPRFASFKAKWDDGYRERWGILNAFAEGLPEKIAPTAANLARRIFRLLQMRGYGRIDMRLASDGQLYVVEANPNPDIGKSEDFAEAAAKAGIAYKDLIQRITRMSLTSAPAL